MCLVYANEHVIKAFKPHSYLHAIIFIIDILDPRNELTSIEAIPHRFVLITLATHTMSQRRSGKYSPSVTSLVKKVSIKNALIIYLYIFFTWLSDGILYTSESSSMVQALNGTA